MDRARMCDRLAQTGFAIAGGPRAANLSAALSDTMRTDSGDFLLGLDALGKNATFPAEAGKGVPQSPRSP